MSSERAPTRVEEGGVVRCEGATLPGYWELLWMLFMMPVRLQHRLKACGIEKPDDPAWRMWFAPGPDRDVRRMYVARMMFVLLTATPISTLLISSGLSLGGVQVKWEAVVFGDILGMIGGTVFGMAGGVAWGVAGGMAFGVAGVTLFEVIRRMGWVVTWVLTSYMSSAMAEDMSLAISIGMIWGGTVGVAWNVAWDVARGLTKGVTWGAAVGMALGVAVSVLLGVAMGSDKGVAKGVAFALSMALGVTAGVLLVFILSVRLWFSPIEVLLSTIAYAIARLRNTNTLHLTPVLYHDLSRVPIPFLESHILLTADKDRALVRRVLDACAIAPGQRRIGQRALCALQARELETCARERRFLRVIDLQAAEGSSDSSWLPGVQGAPPTLLAFSDLARFIAAADKSPTPHHRRQHIEKAESALVALDNQLLADNSPLARALHDTLPTWKQVTRDIREKATLASAGTLPNPFRPGDALAPDIGKEVFRGREGAARKIESLLADSSQRISISLLAPRRAGKSSLLKMLPALLPDAVCIFFDLQDNPVDSPAGFFQALVKAARDQARRDRRIDPPPLPEGTPFESGSVWLKALDDAAGDKRILLCIDEIERLEKSFPGDSRDLDKLMGLFRATIQHRNKVRLLVSGAAPFDELSQLWNDHFINVQEIRLDLLDERTSKDLLMHPFPEFPESAIPEPVAARIYERSGGQPLLLQAYGYYLVEHLNDQKREPRIATLDDLAAVEPCIFERFRSYFANTVKYAPDHARAALVALAHGEPVALDKRTRRWLRRRCLITDDDRLRIPLLADYIREELDD